MVHGMSLRLEHLSVIFRWSVPLVTNIKIDPLLRIFGKIFSIPKRSVTVARSVFASGFLFMTVLAQAVASSGASDTDLRACA